MKKFILYILISFLFTFSLCEAKQLENTKFALEKQFDLIDVVELALKNNPQTRQAWLNTEISNAQYKQELSDYYPKISLSETYSLGEKNYKNPDIENTQSESLNPKVSLSYLLFDFGAREASVKDFKYRLKSVKFDENDTVQSLIYSVINAYYDLFSAVATERAEVDTESSRLVAFKAASLRYKLGLVPLTDKLQSETAYAQSQLSRQKAENDVKIKKAKLNFLLNMDPNKKLSLKVPDLKINKQVSSDDIENLMETALKNRPDLASKVMSRKSSEESLKKAKRGRYPTISLSSSYSEVKNLKGVSNNYYDSNVGLTATIPLFQDGYIKK